MDLLRLRVAALAGAAALAFAALGAAPAQAARPATEPGIGCFDPHDVGAGARGAAPRALDHRQVTAEEQRIIEARTRHRLAAKGTTPGAAAAAFGGASIPVYVHVMLDAAGNGDVTQDQIQRQVSVLNQTYGGQEASDAADTGFTFTLAGVNRYRNTSWHQDKQSARYRSRTRQGGADALNIWLVDFKYLGVATFPWDYAQHPRIDGIRVHYDSLPGGGITNYNLGKTATHEAGHWLGLYHTFQGGCTTTNDEVADTPAQSSPTSGCPEGRDSCSLPGLDPIHNYMDYSYDTCYDQFTPGQADRMATMWTAYRG